MHKCKRILRWAKTHFLVDASYTAHSRPQLCEQQPTFEGCQYVVHTTLVVFGKPERAPTVWCLRCIFTRARSLVVHVKHHPHGGQSSPEAEPCADAAAPGQAVISHFLSHIFFCLLNTQMAPTERRSQTPRRSKHYHANRLKSVRHTLLADTKRVLQEIVDDESVSVDEFRLMSNLTGATLDCFFRIDEEKRVAVPLQTKAEIVKQLLYTDRKIRHLKAKAHKSASSSAKRSGGLANDVSLSSIVWNNREKLMTVVLNNVFPPLMLALGVPPQYQTFIRKAIEEFVKWCGKTKSNSARLEEKERKIDQLVKDIEDNESIKSINLQQIQNSSKGNQFLENSVDTVNDTAVSGSKGNWNNSVDKKKFSTYVHTYTHNVVNDVSLVLTESENDATIGVENKSSDQDQGDKINMPTERLAQLKLNERQKKKENTQTVSVQSKIKHLEEAIRFLQIILETSAAKKKYKNSSKREEWLSKRVEYINKDIKNPLLHNSIKSVRSHPLMVFAVVGTLSFVTTRWLLQEVEEDVEETFDEATATAADLKRRDNQVKHRVQKMLRNVKTRHLLTSVPVLLCVLFVTIRRHTMGKFSDLLAGTVQPQKDKIARLLPPESKTYTDVEECLRKTDKELHHAFQSCTSTPGAYYILCKEQYQRRNQKMQRLVLNSHLIRRDGGVRASVAEIAKAVQHNYKSFNVIGRLNTKRKAMFSFGTRRHHSSTPKAISRKKKTFFGSRRRSSS